nr:hypothetical protein [Massilia sp. Se16.2.3]
MNSGSSRASWAFPKAIEVVTRRGAARPLLQPGDRRFDRPGLFHHAHGVLVDLAARFGHADAARRPVQELGLQRVLEARHLLADGGLRRAHLACGFRKRAGLDDTNECPDVAELAWFDLFHGIQFGNNVLSSRGIVSELMTS